MTSISMIRERKKEGRNRLLVFLIHYFIGTFALLHF